MTQNNIRAVKITNVNWFVKNNGKMRKLYLFIALFIVFETIFVTLNTFEYKYISAQHLDFFERFNGAGGDIVLIQRYLLFSYIDNVVIDSFNAWIVGRDFSIPKIIDSLKYNNFTINQKGYILMLISLTFTFYFFLLIFMQIRDQLKYQEIGLQTIYSPLSLILLSKYYKNFYFIKTVGGVKLDAFNAEKKEGLIQMFFNDSEIFLNNDIREIELKKEKMSIFLGMYNFTRLSIFKKEKKTNNRR